MSVHAQGLGPGEEWPVEHDVVRPQELPARHDLEAQAQDVPAVDGAGVRVEHLEGRDGAAYAVEALLRVGFLPGCAGGEAGGASASARRAAGGRGGGLDEVEDGGRGEDRRGFDLDLSPEGGHWEGLSVGLKVLGTRAGGAAV